VIAGPVRLVKVGGEEEVFYVSGGFLEVTRNVVTLLTDTALRADDVDEAAAEAAMQEAERAMQDASAELDYGTAAAQLAEAAAQLRALRQLKNRAQ
jgi:F-type H+-transporting ATPase subunit epsilon